MAKCNVCKDSGKAPCPDCGGRGKKKGGVFGIDWYTCKHCGGAGWINCKHK